MMPGKNEIPIGGFLKQSFVDYPGHISSVVFTQGCNFRCRYCHNPELVYPGQILESGSIDSAIVKKWITENRTLLDAVVITGGEPALHDSLPGFISGIKNSGLKIKLDTNGTNPGMLRRLIGEKQVDYVAMDIKAPLIVSKYKKIAGAGFSNSMMEKVKESAGILIDSGIGYEFRTTLDDSLSAGDIAEIIQSVSGSYFLQDIRANEKNQGNPCPLRAEAIIAGIPSGLKQRVSLSFR